MKLYLGSTVDISYIDLAKSKPNKDFGRAFYLSEDEEPNGSTLHDYDIVYGPIANDRIGAQITRYKQGYISFEEFLKRIQCIDCKPCFLAKSGYLGGI